MSYCTTLVAINSLKSGAHIGLLNTSQMSEGKSTKLTCAEGQVSNLGLGFFLFAFSPFQQNMQKTTTALNMHVKGRLVYQCGL